MSLHRLVLGFLFLGVPANALAQRQLFEVEGTSISDRLGALIRSAGGVDAHGVDDFMVGASDGHEFIVRAGVAYVDSGATGAELFGVEGEAVRETVGASVLGAGDLNRDGLADVLIGRPRSGTNAIGPGRVSCHQIGQDPLVVDFELDDDLVTALEMAEGSMTTLASAI